MFLGSLPRTAAPTTVGMEVVLGNTINSVTREGNDNRVRPRV
jgi:hypothetical protein